MMNQAVQNGRTHLIMEVSSQAYLVKRVYGLTFDVGVFLNISPDHIGPIEHLALKTTSTTSVSLMKNSRAVIINSDMDHFSVLKEQVEDQDHDFYGSQSDNQIENSKAFSFSASGKTRWRLCYPTHWPLQPRKCRCCWTCLPPSRS